MAVCSLPEIHLFFNPIKIIILPDVHQFNFVY